jgi:predicted alpha-1,6-mannanase (GH76 family)
MGFLKDLATLTPQGNTAYARMDVGARLTAAQQSLDQANQVMAATVTATDPWLEAARLRTTATVVAARQLPMMIGMNAVVELELIVAMAGGIPMPATRTEQVAPLHLARVMPGARLDVSVVPGRPETTRVEWGA